MQTVDRARRRGWASRRRARRWGCRGPATTAACSRRSEPQPRPTPARALPPEEREAVLDVAARAALRGPGAGGGLRHAARRGPLPVLGAHDVPHPGRERRGARAARPAPPPALRRARAAGHAAERAVELGHHQAAGPGEVDLLLPVRDPRRVQPLRGGLDGGRTASPRGSPRS